MKPNCVDAIAKNLLLKVEWSTVRFIAIWMWTLVYIFCEARTCCQFSEIAFDCCFLPFSDFLPDKPYQAAPWSFRVTSKGMFLQPMAYWIQVASCHKLHANYLHNRPIDKILCDEREWLATYSAIFLFLLLWCQSIALDRWTHLWNLVGQY